MQRTRYLYTCLLSAVGFICLIQSVLQLHAGQVAYTLSLTMVAVLLNFFPVQLPNGERWSASSICILFLFFETSFFSTVFAIGCSTLSYFLRVKHSDSYSSFLRLFGFIGAYCAGLTAVNIFVMIHLPNHWNVFLHAFGSLIVYELISLTFINVLTIQNPDFPIIRLDIRNFRYSVLTILVGSIILAQLKLHVHDQFFYPILFGSLTILTSFIVLSREHVKAEQARHQSETKYQLIATHTSDLILILRPDGIIDYISPSICNISSSINPQYLVNHSIFDSIDFVNPGIPLMIFDRVCKDGNMQRTDLQLRFDDAIYDFDTQISPVHTKTGELTLLVVVARDITERKRNEVQMNRTEKLAIAGELAASVAHEIRNPLTALKGFLQLSKDSLNDRIGTFSIMWNELIQIERIISELLLLAKPQSSQKITMDVADIMDSVVRFMQSQAHEHNIHITFATQKFLPHIVGDGNQIRQLFINLIKNAIEAMSAGGTISIDMGLVNGEQIFVEICDEGSGIPIDRINRLGEPFYTTKKKGTGLGLMVSYNIVRDHNGTLTFKSKPNIGTIAEIKLPLFSWAQETCGSKKLEQTESR